MNRFKSTKTLSEDHPPRNPKNQNKKSHPHNLFHNFTQFIKKKKKNLIDFSYPHFTHS